MATVKVLWFASLKEWRGCSEEQVNLLPGDTVGALFQRLVPAHLRPSVRFAVAGEWASAEVGPADGDEVVFLPPVGGG